MSKPKVLIIFPNYCTSASSHYPYWYRIFEEVGDALDIKILFESGEKINKKLGIERLSTVQKHYNVPFNLIERFWLMQKLIYEGYFNIYIHYSYWAVIISWVIKTIYSAKYPIKIYYWNCERYDVKPKDFLLNLSLKLCDVLVTGHQVIANSYRQTFKLGDKPISIVPNWVEESSISEHVRVSHSKKSRSHLAPTAHILFVHHLSPRKGSRELPQIISDVVEKIPYAQFHIVGEGPDKKWLDLQISLMGLTENVTLYGNLPLKQVQKMYHQMDLFIMPSRAEGFPRVILEAMINKIPFVATDVGCVKSISSELQKPFIVEACDPTIFSHALCRLMKQKKIESERITLNNYKIAQGYSLSYSQKCFKNLLKLSKVNLHQAQTSYGR